MALGGAQQCPAKPAAGVPGDHSPAEAGHQGPGDHRFPAHQEDPGPRSLLKGPSLRKKKRESGVMKTFLPQITNFNFGTESGGGREVGSNKTEF